MNPHHNNGLIRSTGPLAVENYAYNLIIRSVGRVTVTEKVSRPIGLRRRESLLRFASIHIKLQLGRLVPVTECYSLILVTYMESARHNIRLPAKTDRV